MDWQLMLLRWETVTMKLDINLALSSYLAVILSPCYCCSVTKWHWIVHDRMDFSTPGFLVPHHLPKFARLYVLNQWCHPIISSLLPCSTSAFNLSQNQHLFHQLFTSAGQNIGASASAPVLPKSIQFWFSLRLTGLVSALRGCLWWQNGDPSNPVELIVLEKQILL